MHSLKISCILGCLVIFVLGMSISPAVALDPNSGIQDRYSKQSTGKILLPSGREPVTKKPLTPEQKFDLIFSRIATLEQTVATLQNQVTIQTQQIAQLRQVISVNSSGAVTIQASNALTLSAGSTVNVSASLVDVQAGLTGIHGVLKADTMMTTTVIAQSYTPGAGNIW